MRNKLWRARVVSCVPTAIPRKAPRKACIPGRPVIPSMTNPLFLPPVFLPRKTQTVPDEKSLPPPSLPALLLVLSAAFPAGASPGQSCGRAGPPPHPGRNEILPPGTSAPAFFRNHQRQHLRPLRAGIAGPRPSSRVPRIRQHRPGQRTFALDANGTPLDANLDVWAKAGGAYKSLGS